MNVRRFLVKALRILVPDSTAAWNALRCMGAGGMFVVFWYPTQRIEPRYTGPAPRHPERLVPDLPPTPEEARLWTQLAEVAR